MTRIHLASVLVVVAVLPATALQTPYKRVHQTALRKLLRGKVDEALDSLAKHPDLAKDPETLYLHACAEARRGNVEAAEASLDAALSAGLPAGRALAGTKTLLPGLADTALLKRLHERFAHVPVHGPMIGNVTPNSAMFWVRTARACDVEVVVASFDDPKKQFRGRDQSSEEADYTAKVRVDGLSPDTRYRFSVRIAGEGAGAPQAPQWFRTAPEDGTSVRFKFAFGGGAGFVPAHERMWTTIGSFEPRFLLLLGDNVYIDDPKSTPMQRYCYYRRQSRPEFRDLLRRTPVYSTWDDHDFGTNDCWGGPEIDKPTWKRTVWETFRQNWINPGYGGGARQPGTWYTFQIGDVEFFVLDGRYYRSDPREPNPSMLGKAQKNWLVGRLARSKARIKFVCSGVPWVFKAKGKSKDTWNGFRAERDEIFAALEKYEVDGVILLSADRHRSDAWRIDRRRSYPLFEFNSSRLTNQHVHPRMKKALFSYNAKQSFGLVTVDTTINDPTVTYDVMSIDGEKVETLTVKLSEIRTPR